MIVIVNAIEADSIIKKEWVAFAKNVKGKITMSDYATVHFPKLYKEKWQKLKEANITFLDYPGYCKVAISQKLALDSGKIKENKS